MLNVDFFIGLVNSISIGGLNIFRTVLLEFQVFTSSKENATALEQQKTRENLQFFINIFNFSTLHDVLRKGK
ncbi:hypothetical protein JTE90_014224 [Oedothorax gibbosus]|uniref:Uncharacterized protein n=1 Tax=Oedothorax gibbosus TaxID=931172 RepID=A0AAV6TRB9_9ARAC|nr:hypothetical protein JTE90_014224 [Oedothorax gibbosus]